MLYQSVVTRFTRHVLLLCMALHLRNLVLQCLANQISASAVFADDL